MKALVIYDSVFGNTEKVAQSVGKALGSPKEAQVVRVTDANIDQLKGLDLLIVASPTRGFQATEPTTKFLKSIPENGLQGMRVSAFDTRISPEKIGSPIFRFIVTKGGYADKRIAKLLVQKGGQLVEPTGGFFVEESEGPLTEGELERAAEWAKKIKGG